MSYEVNSKVRILEQPQTIALNVIAEQLKSEGKNIINMVLGELISIHRRKSLMRRPEA